MQNVTDTDWFQATLVAAERVVILRAELAAAEEQYRAVLAQTQSAGDVSIAAPSLPSDGHTRNPASVPATTVSSPVASAPTAGEAPPVTHRVLARLEEGPATFGELWVSVKAQGKATKFGVRSALHKYREKGDVAFNGTHYSLKKRK